MTEHKTRGTWGIRLVIRLFTLALAILIYWLLGFLVEDIESIKGPDYDMIEKRYVEQSLLEKKDQLKKQIEDLDREISNRREQQRLVGDSSENLQRTINQLLEL